MSCLRGAVDRRDEELWVVWAPEHRGWWAPLERGYVSIVELESAGRYSARRALAIWWESRFTDTPMPLEAARELVQLLAHQRPTESAST